MTKFNEVAEVLARCQRAAGAEQFIEYSQKWWAEWLHWAELVLLRLGHNTQCAEDLLQEFLLGLALAFDRGSLSRNAGCLTNFCRRVMRNRAIEHCHRCGREQFYGLEPPSCPVDYQGHQELFFEELCRCAELTEEQVRILRLKQDGYTWEEIGAELGTGGGSNLRSRYHRILAKLRVKAGVILEVPHE